MAFVLEPEQELLFTQLVEAVRSVPRTDRQPFMAIRRMGGDILQGNGYSGRVLNEDLVALSDTGLIRITNYHDRGGGFNFVIPPTALAYYEDLKSSGREPTEQIEQEVLSYLDALSFQERYPVAYARWTDAVELLWQSDSADELSTIGHKCREAMQEFLTELIDRLQVQGADQDKARTRDRFSAVLAARRADLGEARSALLDALFDYWRAVADLVQRQEHAGQREGEPLLWEDGRQVVFQTAIVMFEVDRSV